MKSVKEDANSTKKNSIKTKNNTIEDEQIDKDLIKPINQTNMHIVIDPELKSLYDYVFNDMKASDNLNSIFDKTEVKNVEKDNQIICEKDQKEQDKVDNMCYNPITEHHENISYDHIQSDSLIDQSSYDFVGNK